MGNKFVGRGNKAPTRRPHVRVPEPIKDDVLRVTAYYRQAESSDGLIFMFPLIITSPLCAVSSAPRFTIGDYVSNTYWIYGEDEVFLFPEKIPEEKRELVRCCIDEGVIRGLKWTDVEPGFVPFWYYSVLFYSLPAFPDIQHPVLMDIPEMFLERIIPKSPQPPSC